MSKEFTVRELHDAIMELLVRPEPRKLGDNFHDVEVDWDQLRLMMQVKIYRENVRMADLARTLGVADTALGKFLASTHKQLEANSLIRLMMWLGYTDFTEFLKEV